MLWTKPSRDWFNGIPAAPIERRTLPKGQNVWGPNGSGHNGSGHNGSGHNESGQGSAHGNGQGDQQSSGPNQVPPGPIQSGDSEDGPRTWSGFGTSSATGQQSDEPVTGADRKSTR